MRIRQKIHRFIQTRVLTDRGIRNLKDNQRLYDALALLAVIQKDLSDPTVIHDALDLIDAVRRHYEMPQSFEIQIEALQAVNRKAIDEMGLESIQAIISLNIDTIQRYLLRYFMHGRLAAVVTRRD